MTSPQPPAHRPRKDGRWPLQRPTLPPGVSDGRGWVTVNRPTRPDRDPARLINRRACALRFTLTWHISSIWFRQSGFGAPANLADWPHTHSWETTQLQGAADHLEAMHIKNAAPHLGTIC